MSRQWRSQILFEVRRLVLWTFLLFRQQPFHCFFLIFRHLKYSRYHSVIRDVRAVKPALEY